MHNPTQEMLNEDDAARFLGVSVRTLQSWRVSGRGPVYAKLSRSVRYSKKRLEAWIEDNTQRHTSEGSAR